MDIEISGSYPIILDGETAGELTVAREGLFWSFEAKCEPRNEIIRLSVYGDGKEGYLGIMEPFGDMLKLNRKFSRAALKDFPAKISHAAQKGELELIEPIDPEVKPDITRSEIPEAMPIESRPAPAAPQLSADSPLPCDYSADIEPSVPLEEDKPPPKELAFPQLEISELDWHPCAIPCSLFSGIKEKRVCSYITSALIAQAGEFSLLAVPESIAISLPDTNVINFVDEICFSGEKHLLCIIKDGKSVSEF